MFKLRKDIEQGLKKYPSLYFDTYKEAITVEGTFTAYDKVSGIEIENYEIKIVFPQSYPYRFPIVEETSRKIPRDISRHVKGDGTLCLANPQDELNVCSRGITFTWFLDEILNTHLCREYAREKTKKYPTGERSHGNEGIWEGYYDILHTTDKETVLKEVDMILNHGPIGRNDPCYCDSGKKYKACHDKIEPQILGTGKNFATDLLELLKKDFEERK
jgi:hypothetical protein